MCSSIHERKLQYTSINGKCRLIRRGRTTSHRKGEVRGSEEVLDKFLEGRRRTLDRVERTGEFMAGVEEDGAEWLGGRRAVCGGEYNGVGGVFEDRDCFFRNSMTCSRPAT